MMVSNKVSSNKTVELKSNQHLADEYLTRLKVIYLTIFAMPPGGRRAEAAEELRKSGERGSGRRSR